MYVTKLSCKWSRIQNKGASLYDATALHSHLLMWLPLWDLISIYSCIYRAIGSFSEAGLYFTNENKIVLLFFFPWCLIFPSLLGKKDWECERNGQRRLTNKKQLPLPPSSTICFLKRQQILFPNGCCLGKSKDGIYFFNVSWRDWCTAMFSACYCVEPECFHPYWAINCQYLWGRELGEKGKLALGLVTPHIPKFHIPWKTHLGSWKTAGKCSKLDCFRLASSSYAGWAG